MGIRPSTICSFTLYAVIQIGKFDCKVKVVQKLGSAFLLFLVYIEGENEPFDPNLLL